MKRFLTLALLPLGVFLAGCSNPWKDNYLANPTFRSVEFEPTPGVTVRRVEPERLEAYHQGAHERAVGRDLPPEEWPEEWQIDEKREFLRTLRVLENPKEVFFLGSSEFAWAGTLDLFGDDLAEFARGIGADYVVVAERYIGLREKIIHVPVHTTVWSSGGYRGGHRGRGGRRGGRGGRGGGYSFIVTHEPRVVAVDSYHYIAYFLRRTSEDEFNRLRASIWGG